MGQPDVEIRLPRSGTSRSPPSGERFLIGRDRCCSDRDTRNDYEVAIERSTGPSVTAETQRLLANSPLGGRPNKNRFTIRNRDVSAPAASVREINHT